MRDYLFTFSLDETTILKVISDVDAETAYHRLLDDLGYLKLLKVELVK